MGKTKDGKGSGPGPGPGRNVLSWNKGSSRVSKSKVRQAICRYCKKSIAAQNYGRHLKETHKEEWEANPKDLREFGDKAIRFFKPAVSEEVLTGVKAVGGDGEERDLNEDEVRVTRHGDQSDVLSDDESMELESSLVNERNNNEESAQPGYEQLSSPSHGKEGDEGCPYEGQSSSSGSADRSGSGYRDRSQAGGSGYNKSGGFDQRPPPARLGSGSRYAGTTPPPQTPGVAMFPQESEKLYYSPAASSVIHGHSDGVGVLPRNLLESQATVLLCQNYQQCGILKVEGLDRTNVYCFFLAKDVLLPQDLRHGQRFSDWLPQGSRVKINAKLMRENAKAPYLATTVWVESEDSRVSEEMTNRVFRDVESDVMQRYSKISSDFSQLNEKDDIGGIRDLEGSLVNERNKRKEPTKHLSLLEVDTLDEEERVVRGSSSLPTLKDFKKIEVKIDEIIGKQKMEIPSFTGKSTAVRVLSKLEMIKAGIEVKDAVKDINTLAVSLSKLFTIGDSADDRQDDNDIDKEDLFHHCRSIEDIEVKAAEFKYMEGYVTCLVCESKFKYGIDQPREFGPRDIQSRPFRNLKKVLKKHLQTEKHSEKLKKSQAVEEVQSKEMSRNKKIGQTLGRSVYKGIYTGTAHSLYPIEVAMLAKEKVDVGELNHSVNFSTEFADCVGEVVKARVVKYLSSPLAQTGLKPPVKVVADKATHKHWSNNLTGVVTLVPGATSLIQGIFLGAPRCERSTGEALSEDIRITLNKNKVAPDQVTGLAADGAYTHCSVGEKLDEKLGISGFHDTDFCHLAGRVDINLRGKDEFQWVTQFVLTVSKTNKLINWGQSWHIFFKTVQAMISEGYDISLRVPRMMSDTRFPNYVSKVFTVLRLSWPALVGVMQKLVAMGMKEGATAKQKERAKEAEALQGLIFNTRFAVKLSLLTDVYNTFGFGVNCLQVVNSLPYVKMDTFNKGVLQRYSVMLETVRSNKCPCKNYVAREGRIVKIISSDEEENNSETEEEDELYENNNKTKEAEDSMMQLDGLEDSFDSDDIGYNLSDKDAEEPARPNIFTTTQQYLDDMSDGSSVLSLSLPTVTLTTTQDYLDAMSDSEVSAATIVNTGEDNIGLAGDIEGGVLNVEEEGDGGSTAGLEFIEATASEREGVRVFKTTVDDQVEEEFCFFPNGHKDIREMRSVGTYRGFPIGSLLPPPVHAGTRSGKQQHGISVLLNQEDIIKEVEGKVVDLIEHLKVKLSEKVFTPRTQAMMEHTRTLLDIKSLLKKLVTRSPADLANILYRSFRNASIVIEPNLFINIIDEVELRVQYREYLMKLKNLVDEKNDMLNWDSLKILTKIFDGTEFSLNIEGVMGVLARATVTIGIESVVESWVSVMERHNSKSRSLGEKMVITETAVNINGPNPVNCDGVVEQALQLYCSKYKKKNNAGGHFIRKSDNIKSWLVSKSVDKVNAAKPKFPFMM